jgi:circadian clock protein KaiC
MKNTITKHNPHPKSIGKCTTVLTGLDEITGGGLPEGRPTLVSGNDGRGKTLLATEFLVRSAVRGEPGLFVTLEETAAELVENVAPLGFDLASLVSKHRLHIDHVQVERSEIEETGEFDLDGEG